MQARGRKSEERVARFDGFSSKNFLSLDYADNEACEIIFSRRIKARHLRGFAANQRASCFAAGAAHALDKLLDNRGIKFSHSEVVEEKKR